jgi:hypothetical protein
MTPTVPPLSWRPSEWLAQAGHPFSRPILYREIAAGRITAVKAGKNTLILTPPRDYLLSLPRGVSAPIRKQRRAAS